MSQESLQVFIGRRLRAQRSLLGLNQEQVADRTGIPQEHLSRYERGRFTSINPERLVLLADILGCTVDYLLGREKDTSQAA